MGGQGKTTLTRKIYKNDQLKRCFDRFAWADVSEDWKAEALSLSVGSSEINLREKQYFVVLGDIWRPEVWHAINDAFLANKNGSRILITSRSVQVARVASVSQEFVYQLPSLNEEQSWELLSKRVFVGEQCPPDLEDLGRKMAGSCVGLPLSIVVLAGILAKLEKSKVCLSYVAGNEIWHLFQQKAKCIDVLALSYKFFPQNLKPCFLYVGHYPEDLKIYVKKLMELWIAEGLIPKETGNKIPEDVAEYYLMELIDRSLIQVESKRTDGGVKVCGIHDLLRAFCIEESKKQKFYDIITTTGSSNLISPRRLFVYQKPSTYLTSSLSANHSSVRSLIFFGEGEDFTYWKAILKDFKLVQILDISSVFMAEIEKSGLPDDGDVLGKAQKKVKSIEDVGARAEIATLKEELVRQRELIDTLLKDKERREGEFHNSPSRKGSFNVIQPVKNLPEGKNICELLANSLNHHVVAIGRVFNMPRDTLHNMPLLASYVRVAIDVSKDLNYTLPIPTKDAGIVGEVMGSFVGWQSTNVKMPSPKKANKDTQSKKKTVQISRLSSKIVSHVAIPEQELQLSSQHRNLLQVYAMIHRSNPPILQIPFEAGIYSAPRYDMLSLDITDEVLQHEMTNLTVLSFYIW
ncbi:putative disease resistance RPP13-like protein 3 [Prosopis cineraria]|uniref:putative disease resistance RPP13-like protein 3 n=1 Tax=Prosopis cineraria TaxID=364024 RepID=UPI002410720A|nr:putative disease resistance RPP13-like protein 3 [Prosopis cineraria]